MRCGVGTDCGTRHAKLERCSELATRLDAAAGEVELARTQEAELASEAEQHRSFLASASAETAAAKEVAASQLNQVQQAAHRVAQSEGDCGSCPS